MGKGKAPIDLEFYPYADKSRRLFVEILELLLIGFASLFVFSLVTSNVIKVLPHYKEYEQERIKSEENLYKIGEESGLVYRYSSDNAADQYDMFKRYCYKQIHKSFNLFPDDFKNANYVKIDDPYKLSAITKETDELEYFFTDYAIREGLISTTDPLSNYKENILDLEKYHNLFVYYEPEEIFILNPEFDRVTSTENVAVILYTELINGQENGAMKEINKFYNEYYELANSYLESSPKYQEQFGVYENMSLKCSKFISYGFTINYFILAISYFLIMPLITKTGITPIRKFCHYELCDSDGYYLTFFKKLLYGLIKIVLCFYALAIPFYTGYGQSFFIYPYGVTDNFVFTPLLFLIISFGLWFINVIPIYFGKLNENKTTLIEFILNIRIADRRMDFEGGRKNEKK